MENNQRYMPQDYAAKMRAARRERAMRGERRIITILFCDVVGSTAMAGQLDPEEWAEIMNEAFEFLITPIYRYEGTVARLMGDAILAFFGAPIAHEDDPQRAILAALAIVEGIQDFAAEIRADYGLDFNVRVGINTGPVVVGEVGTDLALEYTAMGDAINLASRMESTADPGTVQITASTHSLIAPLFNVQEVGSITVKGKEDPVPAYCVLGLKASPGRLRGIGGQHAPLVGREAELSTLIELVQNVQKGQGQIVCLTAEAGLGKSRLLEELKAYFNDDIVAENIGWVEGRGISYDSARPFGVIMQMFRQLSGVNPSDSPDVARGKIRAQIASFQSEAGTSMAHAIEVLLDVMEGGADMEQDGEALHRELFTAFLTTWRQTTNNLSIVAVHDDIQWADPASIDLLIHLFQLVSSTPSLFICSFRPQQRSSAQRIEEAAGQSYARYFTSIRLRPLTADEGAVLVDGLIGTTGLPQELCDRILQRADGNPYFIEEVVRALIERGVLVKEADGYHMHSEEDIAQIDIPNSVLSLLVSRIDRLELETKRVVQLAAVIGRSFYRRVLERIVDPALELDKHLFLLQKMGLIESEAGAQEPAYLFRQAMTRDAAYQSLLYRQRRRTHRRIAEELELLFSGQINEESHQLAYHFYAARDFKRALSYYRLAGDQAAHLYAHREAVERYGRALEIALSSGSDDDIRYLYMARGRIYELNGRYDDALSDYRSLQASARERDNHKMRLEGLLAETTLFSTFTDHYDPQQGRSKLEEALELAEEVDDRRAQAKIYWTLLLQGTFGQDDPLQIVAYGEKAEAIAREEGLQEELAFALNDLARPYTQIGKMDKAADVLQEAGELWRAMGNKAMLADNRATLASGYRYLGRFQEGLALAQEAQAISLEIGNDWGLAYSSNVMGPIYMDLGRIGAALETWQRAIPAAGRANFVGALAFVKIDMGLAYGYIGETEKGLHLVREAYEKMVAIGQQRLAILPLLAMARLHLYTGQTIEAKRHTRGALAEEELTRANIVTANLFATVQALIGLSEGRYIQVIDQLDAAITHAQDMNMVGSLMDLWRLKGQTLIALNRLPEATAILHKAHQTAERTAARGHLWQILKVQLEAAEKSAGHQQTRQLRVELENEVNYIAEQIGDSKLGARFRKTIVT